MKINNHLAIAKTSNNDIFSEDMTTKNPKDKNIVMFIRLIIKYSI